MRSSGFGLVSLGLVLSVAVIPALSQTAAPDPTLDPLYRSIGDHKRNYYLPDISATTPSRVYVPRTWNLKKQMPLVVMLHGAGLTEDAAFDRAPEDLKGIVEQLADKHEFILVAPLIYKGNSGGVFMGTGPTPAVKVINDARAAGAKDSDRNGPPQGPPPGAGPGGRGGPGGPGFPRAASKPPDANDNRIAEDDVLNIIKMMSKGYNIDPSRIYLMGNSMGSLMTWSLAQGHPEIFAAISPSAAGVWAAGYPYERLKGMGIHMVVGDGDHGLPVMRETAESFKAVGIPTEEIEVKGGQHPTAWYMALPGTFDFFDKYSRKK